MQLYSQSMRSNMLRISSLTFLLLASVGGSLAWTRYFSWLAMELGAWATERFMLPWRLSPAKGCSPYMFRFIMGFFVGVHFVDSTRENSLWLRPRDAPFPSVRGFSIYGNRAFIRYRAKPVGVLLAYLEGLGMIPIRFIRHGDESSFRVYFLGALYVYNINISNETYTLCSEHESLACASRFPFRRVLAGVLWRLS